MVLAPFFVSYATAAAKLDKKMNKLFPIFYSPEGDGGTPPPTPNEGADGGAETTFTQAQMDAIISQRSKRAEKSATSKLLESLGAESPEGIKAQLEELQKLKAAAMSDEEKAKADLEAMRVQLAEANEATKKAQAAAQRQLVESAILLAAGNFQDPQDALQFVDMTKIVIEDGKVTGVDEALKAVAESKAYLLKATDGKPRGSYIRQPVKPVAPAVNGQQQRRPTVSF